MLSARLRIFSSLLLISSTLAREQSLFTSSVSYCEDPDSLLIQQFDVAYFSANNSVSFSIQAASVDPNVSVSASLLLNVYGMTPVNISVDLCNVLSGVLCPLPTYNFSGSDSIPLPQSLGVSNRIPGIAFKIPDLEGFTQLQLTEISTGKVKACVQATLSNGWSTFQPAVPWSTGGVALLAFVIAAWHSLSSESLLASRLLDLIYLYQTIASSAFFSLNYPSVYRSFALNFAWSMGLFSSPRLQNAINDMRHRTGGNLPNSTSGDAVSLVNRKFSPYNNLGAQTGFTTASLPVMNTLKSFAVSHLRSFAASVNSNQATEVQTVTAASSNVLEPGVPTYVNSMHIATANAMMTVFLCLIILLAIALGVFLLGFLSILTLEHFKLANADRVIELRYRYKSFFRAWLLRLSLALVLPVTVFTFYQWTLKDSWLSVFLSVILFFSISICILYSAVTTIRLARSSTAYALFSNPHHLATHGPLYSHYRIPRYYFFAPLLCMSFLKAIFIASAQDNGLVQVVLSLILEIFGLLAICILRPHPTKGGDALSIYLGVVRVICTGLLLAFTVQLKVAAIPRVAIGLVTAVIFSVAVIVVVINLVLNVVAFHRQGRSSNRSTRDTDEAALEKGEETLSAPYSFKRPRNPTPENNTPMDPETKEIYPATPTTDHRTSASTNFGNVLPQRWTFTPLNSPSVASELDGTVAGTLETPSHLSHEHK
ncbi:hypothetical protein C8J56DRAFT_821773 [Mycena floridula]|nr:hypothetical protein C8J56DRAFT_821773 [Mycena floridula]